MSVAAVLPLDKHAAQCALLIVPYGLWENMRITGIYKITNLVNGKFYIGQSRDIYVRWKAHTLSINETSSESVIRMAFAKYGLRQQISMNGIFDNFKFEVIEQCDEEQLSEREYYYIKELEPQYNVQLMGVNKYFTKKDTQKSQNFIQYHSLEKMGYYPGESNDDSISTENVNYGIFTRKRLAINMLGSSVILILGGKPKNCIRNRYYLWSELVIEDIQFDEENNDYIIQGIENLPNKPIDITDIDGFNEFRMKCGNFAYGLQSMKNKPFFFEKILPLIQQNKLLNHISYNKWIENFIKQQDNKF